MIRSMLLLLISICFICFARVREAATKVKPRSDSHFSAESAMDYLKIIAKETHPIGSIANMKVRDYLVDELTKLGLTTTVESGNINTSYGTRYNRTAYVENVISVLPGSEPGGKKVVLAAHYDSVFEGPGAADDGYAVAAMIETVKLLKKQPRKNDIQLVITDGEEMGLLGARLHSEKYDMSDVGILLNYEARGNQGPCNSFEWSDDNAWLVREMKKVSIRPIASSLSYEIYKRMPNSSDFTAFAKNNISGINHAFIDGFSYYHNPADNVENISMNSFQHTGENMYLMAQHFANYDFSKKETGNASFFNFYGLLIAYPASVDLYLLILLGLLLLIAFVLGNKKDEIKVSQLIKSLALVVLSILLIGGVNIGLAIIVKSLYPQYGTFYIYHYYNHEWYFLAGLGLSVLILVLMSRWIISSQNKTSQGLGLLIVMSMISVALYLTMPTGTFIMLLPTLGLAVLIIGKLLSSNANSDNWIPLILYVFFLAGMWTFLSHGLFLAFSLGSLPGAVFPATVATLSTMYLIPSAWNNSGRKIILGFGLLLFVGSLIIAHIKTKPTEKEPLLTNIKYVYDGENNKSYIATGDDYIHDGHQNIFDDAETGRLPKHLTYSAYYKEQESQITSLTSMIFIDSLANNNANSYKIINPRRASIAYLRLPDASNIDSVFLNNKFNNKISQAENKERLLTLYGIGLDTLNIKVTKINKQLPAKMYVNMKYSGLIDDRKATEGIAWNDPNCYISHVINVD